MDDEWLFALGAPPPTLTGYVPSEGGRKPRTDDWHRLAETRVRQMHTRFGPGPADTPCRDCVHLIHRRPGANKFLKCEVAGVSASDATDWRARWPACGAYERRTEP